MMKTLLSASTALTLVVGLLASFAITETSGQSKISYASGGVGAESREELAARAKEFNFKLVTAMERSGEYLAGAKVKVIDAAGAQLLQTTMEGPWLLADLPPGKYTVEATHSGKTLTKVVAIPESGQREAYLYWSLPDQMTPVRPPEAPPAPWASPGAAKR